MRGSLRHTLQLGDLGHREAAEEFEVDDVGQLGFEQRELIERFADPRQASASRRWRSR